MNCPGCNAASAYVGVKTIECVNVECKHFSERWFNEQLDKELKGVYKNVVASTRNDEITARVCSSCSGNGYDTEGRCTTCRGSGYVRIEA